MAFLGSQYPHLALHLTDRSLTPILSSSSSTSSPLKRSVAKTLSASPSSSDEDQEETPAEEADSTTLQTVSLAHLTATALAAYDLAKRLGHGAPLRTMVEYPENGPVVLHSYMCPLALVLGPSGHERGGGLDTAEGESEDQQLPPLQLSDDEPEDDVGRVIEGDEEESLNAPPMLIGTVVASRGDQLRDARTAADHLESIGRVFQAEWVAEGVRGRSD